MPSLNIPMFILRRKERLFNLKNSKKAINKSFNLLPIGTE